MEFNYTNQALRRYEKIMDYDPEAPRARTTPPVKIPETIRLADGREFSVRELLIRVSNSKAITLKIPNAEPAIPKKRKPGAGRLPKYTHEDRLWIAAATSEQIQERFAVNPHYSRVMIRLAKQYLDTLS